MCAIDITAEQRKTVLALLARHLPNTTAWVYGSRVKWTSRPQSDLDLVAFATPEQSGRVSDLREVFEESNLAFRVDLFVWDEVPEQFRKQIEAEHVVLVEREERRVGGEWPIMSLREAGVSLIDCEHRTPPAAERGYPYVAIPQVKDGRINLNGVRRITRERFDEWTRKADPKSFDIVLSRRCNPGETGFVSEGLKFALGQNLVLLRSDGTKVFKPFLRWLVRGPRWWDQVGVYINVGAVFDSLKCGDIPGFRLPIPPLPEQRAIAHVLGTLDDKIELNRRMSQTLETMARALFKSWFVDFDPVRAKAALKNHSPSRGSDWTVERAHAYLDRMDPDIAALFPDSFVDSELGPIPVGWEVKALGECFNLTMGQSPPGSTYNEQGEGLPFFQGRSDFGFRYPENRKFCAAPTRIAQPGDTLVSVRAPVGDINMAWERCCIGRGVAALRHKSGTMSFSYYSTWTIQAALREYEQTGTVFGAINKSQFEALQVIAPSPSIVDAFDSSARPLDEKIRSNIAETRTLTTLRDTLLPKLISGELRERDIHRAIRETNQ